ncbi:MAG TPA: ABC transporter permease subunit [Candidatus Saccharimonadales bacterium]|nr:ABC transporter permease subunit [Candidatus Saccharimonadales bacterium]
MNIITTTFFWFTDPAHWQGNDGIPTRIFEHLELSALAVIIGLAIALPAGLWLGHTGRGAFVAVNVANLGRALPSLALLALALPLAFALHLGLGFWPTLFALIPLTIPPILTNTYVAVRGVDREIVEAARGMGLQERTILRAVELPIALPLILSGIRTAAVNVIATATLGALVAGGGLGRYIVDGLALQEYERLFAGALLVAFLAIAVEIGMGQVDKRAVSPGIRGTA